MDHNQKTCSFFVHLPLRRFRQGSDCGKASARSRWHLPNVFSLFDCSTEGHSCPPRLLSPRKTCCFGFTICVSTDHWARVNHLPAPASSSEHCLQFSETSVSSVSSVVADPSSSSDPSASVQHGSWRSSSAELPKKNLVVEGMLRSRVRQDLVNLGKRRSSSVHGLHSLVSSSASSLWTSSPSVNVQQGTCRSSSEDCPKKNLIGQWGLYRYFCFHLGESCSSSAEQTRQLAVPLSPSSLATVEVSWIVTLLRSQVFFFFWYKDWESTCLFISSLCACSWAAMTPPSTGWYLKCENIPVVL